MNFEEFMRIVADKTQSHRARDCLIENGVGFDTKIGAVLGEEFQRESFLAAVEEVAGCASKDVPTGNEVTFGHIYQVLFEPEDLVPAA